MGRYIVGSNNVSLSDIRLNLLWNHDNIYVMDSHLAAYWCWMQHIKKDKRYKFFHIDRHWDSMSSKDGLKVIRPIDISTITINKYLSLSYPDGIGGSDPNIPCFRWDNYIPYLVELHNDIISHWFFATHNEGDKPSLPNKKDVTEYYPWDFIDNDNFKARPEKSIVNIDLDYFFNVSNCEDICEERLIFSEWYLNHFFKTLSVNLNDGSIEVLTIAISPGCCGGEIYAVNLFNRVSKLLGLEIKLSGFSHSVDQEVFTAE